MPVDPPKMEPLDEDERESAGRVEDEVSTSGCDMMEACSVRGSGLVRALPVSLVEIHTVTPGLG